MIIAFLSGAATAYLAASAYILLNAEWVVDPRCPFRVRLRFAVIFALRAPWDMLRHHAGPR